MSPSRSCGILISLLITSTLLMQGTAMFAGKQQESPSLASRGVLILDQGSQPLDVLFSPDGKTLISSDVLGRIHIWDVATGIKRRQLSGLKGMSNRLALTKDGGTLISLAKGGTVVLWNMETGTVRRRLAGMASNASLLAISPNGKQLFWATHGGFT